MKTIGGSTCTICRKRFCNIMHKFCHVTVSENMPGLCDIAACSVKNCRDCARDVQQCDKCRVGYDMVNGSCIGTY